MKTKTVKTLMAKVASVVLAGSLVAASVASAQTVVTLPTPTSQIVATFYDANPADGGEVIVDGAWNDPIRVILDDSAISQQIDGIEAADYLVLTVGDLTLTFDTTGGDRKSTLQLVYDGEPLSNNLTFADNLTLADVVEALRAALAGEGSLAVFTDADGVVAGLYTYDEATAAVVDASAAAYVLVGASVVSGEGVELGS